MSWMKVRSLVLSNHFPFHWWFAQIAALLLLSSDELMSCCTAGTNGCLDLRCRALSSCEWVRTECSRCSDYMARRAKDSVIPLRRSSACNVMAELETGSRCLVWRLFSSGVRNNVHHHHIPYLICCYLKFECCVLRSPKCFWNFELMRSIKIFQGSEKLILQKRF